MFCILPINYYPANKKILNNSNVFLLLLNFFPVMAFGWQSSLENDLQKVKMLEYNSTESADNNDTTTPREYNPIADQFLVYRLILTFLVFLA